MRATWFSGMALTASTLLYVAYPWLRVLVDPSGRDQTTELWLALVELLLVICVADPELSEAG